jgi:hypothetical protein
MRELAELTLAGCGKSERKEAAGAAVAIPIVASQATTNPNAVFFGALHTLLIRPPDESILRCL